MWDVGGELLLPALAGNGQQPQFVTTSADGRYVACVAENVVYLWDLSGKEPRKHVFTLKELSPASLVFSPDSKTLIAGTDSGRMQL